jgi:hypothetical protein
MADLKFDHTKDIDFLKAVGLSEKDMKELIEKFSSISTYIIKETPVKSKLVEKIAETFSYNELVLATTYFLMDKTVAIVKSNPMLSLLSMLKDLEKED